MDAHRKQYIHEAMLIQVYTRCSEWVCVSSEISDTVTVVSDGNHSDMETFALEFI